MTKILISNDDGYHAPGIEALYEALKDLGDVTVMAPDQNRSGASNSLTLDKPLTVRQTNNGFYSVTGTPTDCVVLAVNDLMPVRPDLVLSGVNRGHNVGEDCSYSGTVAGALQGMAFGIRSIALSQSLERFHDEVTAHWETAEAYAPPIISRLLKHEWQNGVVMNLNFPARGIEDVREVEVTRQGFRDIGEMHAVKRTDLRGRDYYWMSFRGAKQDHAPGTDLRAMDDGKISVTPLHIDLTHRESVHDLKGLLGGVPPKGMV